MTMDQPVGYMGQDYDAIVGELEGSGEKFVDEHEKEDLCQTFCDKDIEWIRASKLPCCTDDNGDVAFLRKDLTDEEGNWANNNMEREYDQVDTPNTMMDAVLGTMFWQLEGKPMDIFGKQYKETHYNDKGIWRATLFINGTWVSIPMSDKIPCCENMPVYCKTRSGALWPMMLEKALAKYHGGYNKIQAFPIGSHQTFLSPSDLMMELTGYPSCEYDLAKWHKTVEDGGPDFEERVLLNEHDVRKILCTWNMNTRHKMGSTRFPLKCHNG